MEQNNVKEKKKKGPLKLIGNILFYLFLALFAFVGVTFLIGYSTRNDNYGVSNFYGYQILNVLTDSMEPKYPKDSVIITKKTDAKKLYESFQKNKDNESYYLDISFVMSYSGIEENDIPFTYEGGVWEDILTLNSDNKTIMTHRVVEAYAPTDLDNNNNPFGEYIFITHGINIGGHESQQYQFQVVRAKYILGKVTGRSIVLGGMINFVLSIPGLLCLLILPCGYIIVTTILDTRKKWIEEEKKEEALKASTISNNSNNSTSKLDSLSEEEKERLKKEMLDEMLKKGKE